jgi:septal ring factor EnvC (AmiA/AmiB activator)
MRPLENNVWNLIMRRQAMRYIVNLGIAWLVVPWLAPAAPAQDVPGIEICTRESRMDRRTGCLQSNVEFLQQVVSKNALDAQQKLAAASRDISALREQLAAASRDVVALKDALAAAEARIEQLQKANSSAGPQKPEAKPPGK